MQIAHFTYADNIPSIAREGLLCDELTITKSHRCCGDADIKSRRMAKPIPFGGTVGSYVPFYFAARSPMLYTLHKNGKVVQRELVYLVTSTERLIEKGYTWCCSDMNAAKNVAKFYNTEKDLKEKINWEYMTVTDWRSTDDHPMRMEKRMAEFLVRHGVKLMDFIGVYTYDEHMKTSVEKNLAHEGISLPVKVSHKLYF